MFRKKKIAPELTLEQRAALHTDVAAAHLSAFELAASGLEATANHLDKVRDEASEEATRLYNLKIEADTAAFKHREQAQKIRELIS